MRPYPLITLFLLSSHLLMAHPGHAWDPDGPLEISINHPAFRIVENKLYLGSQLFTGVVVEEAEFKNEKLEASDIPNSILTGRYNYKDGVRHGTFYQWHPNGYMKVAYHFTRGVSSGLQQEWHPNGRPKSKMDFIMGTPYGLEQHWDENGKLIKELVHDPIPDEEGEEGEGEEPTATEEK